MAVDKNLFAHELAFVAIMKDEEPYVKEWLDYHLLAGVDHFYIYDHESTEDFKKILQPYVERRLVTYIFYPGEGNQMEAYNDAIKKFKFECRYMAFIDGDEFVFPKGGRSIVEVVDELLSDKPNAGGLEIGTCTFGSNFQDSADYDRGVLERFTRHENGTSSTVKTITNPRRINFMNTPHFAHYFEGFFGVSQGVLSQIPDVGYKLTDKIVINHYYCKSREEFANKVRRRNAAYTNIDYKMDDFSHGNFNEVFDEGILKYRDERLAALIPTGGGTVLETLAPSMQINYQRLSNALLQNLFPSMLRRLPPNLLQGKMETFLTCRALAAFLRENLLDDESAKALEEASLRAVRKALSARLSLAEAELLLKELPKLLPLDYLVVDELRRACARLILSLRNFYGEQAKLGGKWMLWKEFTEWDYLLDLLKAYENYDIN